MNTLGGVFKKTTLNFNSSKYGGFVQGFGAFEHILLFVVGLEHLRMIRTGDVSLYGN